MKTSSKNSIAYFLLGLSAFIMIACLLGSAVLAMDSGGGFFPNLGKALGLLLIATGNLLSWILNAFCWYLTRLRWLGIVLAIQSVPAMIFAVWLGTLAADEFQEHRASEQRVRIYDAIKADDIHSLEQALRQCSKRCQEYYSPERNLMLASLHGSHQAARYLLNNVPDSSATDRGAHDFYNAHTGLYTCEGVYLPALGALDLAVANQDREMLELLWPAISDEWTRSKALWTAAQLDRLELVKFMTGMGSADSRSSDPTNTAILGAQRLVRTLHRNKPETALRAAASGAAVEVGGWLLETRPIALPPAEIQQSLAELLAFAHDSDTPRSASFGHLLLQHGADIHAATLYGEPALERAVRSGAKPLVTLLLELGADPAGLPDKEAAQFNAVLQETEPRPRTHRQNMPDCVAP